MLAIYGRHTVYKLGPHDFGLVGPTNHRATCGRGDAIPSTKANGNSGRGRPSASDQPRVTSREWLTPCSSSEGEGEQEPVGWLSVARAVRLLATSPL